MERSAGLTWLEKVRVHGSKQRKRLVKGGSVGETVKQKEHNNWSHIE